MTTDQRRRELMAEKDARIASLNYVIDQLKGQIAFVERERDDLLAWQEGAREGSAIAATMRYHARLVEHADEIEKACEVMHDAYEAAAAEAGWETQERSRVPWPAVPEANKITMRRAVSALLAHLQAAADPRCSSCGGSFDSPPCQRNPLTGEGGHTSGDGLPGAGAAT